MDYDPPYQHQSAEDSAYSRQHFVADNRGRPFLRTILYMTGTEEERAVSAWLHRACELMSEAAKSNKQS